VSSALQFHSEIATIRSIRMATRPMAEILNSNIDKATLARMTELANERGGSTDGVALRALR